MDTIQFCNAILYYLKIHDHGDDLFNGTHLSYTAWLINIYYFLKYHESALSPDSLNDFEVGYYGPYNQAINETFDSIYKDQPAYVKSSIQEQFLFHDNNGFDVKVVPFEYDLVPLKVRQIIESHALQIWQADNFHLSQVFQQEPQIIHAHNHFQNSTYSFTQSVDYLKNHIQAINKRKSY